jgi:DNA polymerase (family X)
VDRFAIAQALNDIATLLALQGGARFKVIAYRRAARSLESTPVDLAELVDEQRLTELEHVGEAIARTIAELWHTGRSALRERLASELPPGSLELARVPGLTLKRIAKLHAALGVSTLSEVRAACERHAVRDVPGFGPRTESRILEGIQTFLTRSTRVILSEALAAANTIEAYLRACPELADASLAGQARRRCETVDELVFVALPRSGPTAADLVEHFRRYPAFAATEREPPAGRLASGLRVELRVTSPSRLAGDLFVATGSEAHVQRVLEALPGLEGWSSESDLYAAAGLAFIAPELRENLGEIASARAAKLPALVSDEDLRGFVHCHTRYSDGRNTIEEMARSAERAGMSYVTITDHSPSAHYAGGVTIDRLKEQWEEIARVQELVSIRILRGTESDILGDGALDYPDSVLSQLDVVIASIHSRLRMDRAEMTERLVRAMRHPRFKIWGHGLGRLLLRRPPVECDVERVLDAIAGSRAAIEINGDPHRLDLEPRWVRAARERGIRFVISCDAHSTRGLLATRYGVMMARRAGLTAADVLNTLEPEAFVAAVRPS